MKKGTKPQSDSARQTHQFDLSPTELQDIFNFGGDPERIGSKGRALRAVIERHKEQIHTINALHGQLKQLATKVSEIPKDYADHSPDTKEKQEQRRKAYQNSTK